MSYDFSNAYRSLPGYPAPDIGMIAVNSEFHFIGVRFGDADIVCMRLKHPEHGWFLMAMTREALTAIRDGAAECLARMDAPK